MFRGAQPTSTSTTCPKVQGVQFAPPSLANLAPLPIHASFGRTSSHPRTFEWPSILTICCAAPSKAKRLRPAPESRQPPVSPRRRHPESAHRRPAHHAGRHAVHGVQHDDQPPEAKIQGNRRTRHGLRRRRPGTLPRQRLPAARQRRHGACASSPPRFAPSKNSTCRASSSQVCEEQRGLVLVTGTTGSGKSTTLAAMIDRINSPRSEHIITIEDPIEFLHRDKKGFINQREVEVDTANFSTALRAGFASGPRRHPGRRNARPGNHFHRAARRRNRPPGLLHLAHPGRH